MAIEPHLTRRELECLTWKARGKTAPEIGAILTISKHTVRDHIKKIRRKFDVGNSAQAIVEAIRIGLIDP